MPILEKAKALLTQYPLCDYCLGRQFAMLGYSLSNRDRGRAIKLLLILEGNKLFHEDENAGQELLLMVAINGFSELSSLTLQKMGISIKDTIWKSCSLCNDVFTELDEIAAKVEADLANYDFNSFLVGVKIGSTIVDKEDELRARYKLKWGESIRNDFSREIGRRIMTAIGKEVSFKRPDILVLINPLTMKISLKLNSIFVYGRYKKLKRGFPQAKWVCGLCKGHGCASCQWTGKLYPESVAELISKPILQVTRGSDVKIHAAGREDIDVRVLGSGRPFIIEVLDPINRAIHLHSLEKEINTYSKGKIEVKGLKLTSKNSVSKLKSSSSGMKVYRTLVEFERCIPDDTLFRLSEKVKDTLIQQQTPTRVMHRRANKLRRRRIFKIEVKRISSNLVEMILTCEGGLYIKEFISGDRGRTTLSVSEVTQIPAKSIELDVMNIPMGDIC